MTLRYLTKEEDKPYKTCFISKVNEIRKASRDDFSICFSLVGSSKRNMILVNENNSDDSFDFDYQLWITKDKSNKSIEKIKPYFIKLFQEQFQQKNWKIQDSTSAITIKNKKYNYSYDIPIMKINSKTLKVNVLRHDKPNDEYSWEEVASYKEHKENLKQIKGHDLWSELRKIYKNKKTNDNETKSYLLFIESVHDLVQ